MNTDITPEQMIEDAIKKAEKKAQWLKDIADRMFYRLATGQSMPKDHKGQWTFIYSKKPPTGT